MGFNLDFNNNPLGENLSQLEKNMKAAALMYSVTKAKMIESEMKSKRPWTDRSGLAKAKLATEISEPNESTIRITLTHGVDYGIWLELANEKNYAIIGPTMNSQGPIVMKDLKDLMSKIQKK